MQDKNVFLRSLCFFQVIQKCSTPEGEQDSPNDVYGDTEQTPEESQEESQSVVEPTQPASASRKFTPQRPSTTMLPPQRTKLLKRHKQPTNRFENTITKLQQIAELATTDTEDQYDQFSKHIASQMRELPLRSFILLQSKIQTLITEERLATLYESNTIANNTEKVIQSVVDINRPNNSLGLEPICSESENTYSESSDLCFVEKEDTHNMDIINQALLGIYNSK